MSLFYLVRADNIEPLDTLPEQGTVWAELPFKVGSAMHYTYVRKDVSIVRLAMDRAPGTYTGWSHTIPKLNRGKDE
jgi:hypothetical protein